MKTFVFILTCVFLRQLMCLFEQVFVVAACSPVQCLAMHLPGYHLAFKPRFQIPAAQEITHPTDCFTAG